VLDLFLCILGTPRLLRLAKSGSRAELHYLGLLEYSQAVRTLADPRASLEHRRGVQHRVEKLRYEVTIDIQAVRF
jgi:hypothetical protein